MEIPTSHQLWESVSNSHLRTGLVPAVSLSEIEEDTHMDGRSHPEAKPDRTLC